MKKGIIIGIAIIIIGGIVIAASQNTLDDDNEVIINENVNIEPKQFTIELTESVGFSETP
ncbi:MAG: hypothetical protein HRO68_00255 [Nitrosopumilus sp.]|nr:hypothetical protein [Nitrosopumilus sp.]